MILDWNICDIKRQSVLIDDARPHLFGVSLVLLCWIVRIHGPDLPESLRLLARETRVSDPISDSGFSSATITLGGTLHVNITLEGTLHMNSLQPTLNLIKTVLTHPFWRPTCVACNVRDLR